MISPQMSAWVRLWAWVRRGRALLLFRRPDGAQIRLWGPRPRRTVELPGAAEAPPLLRLSRASFATADRGCSWASKPNKHPPKTQETGAIGKGGGGGAAGRALLAAGYRGFAGSGPQPVPSAWGATGRSGLLGDPMGPLGARNRGKFSQLRRRAAPHPAAPRSRPLGAAVSARRFGG